MRNQDVIRFQKGAHTYDSTNHNNHFLSQLKEAVEGKLIYDYRLRSSPTSCLTENQKADRTSGHYLLIKVTKTSVLQEMEYNIIPIS